MTQIFTMIENALCPDDERITLSIAPMGDGRIRVSVIPQLSEKPDAESRDADLRSALTVPLVFTDTAEVLDRSFVDLLRNYAIQRSSLSAALPNAIGALQEANKKAVSAATTREDSGPKEGGSRTSAAAVSDDDILL